MLNFEVCAYLVKVKSKIQHFERGRFAKVSRSENSP